MALVGGCSPSTRRTMSCQRARAGGGRTIPVVRWFGIASSPPFHVKHPLQIAAIPGHEPAAPTQGIDEPTEFVRPRRSGRLGRRSATPPGNPIPVLPHRAVGNLFRPGLIVRLMLPDREARPRSFGPSLTGRPASPCACQPIATDPGRLVWWTKDCRALRSSMTAAARLVDLSDALSRGERTCHRVRLA